MRNMCFIQQAAHLVDILILAYMGLLSVSPLERQMMYQSRPPPQRATHTHTDTHTRNLSTAGFYASFVFMHTFYISTIIA